MAVIKKGATDVTMYVFLGDSADGTPETALTITNLDLTYIRNRAAAVKVDATALTTVTDAHTDNKAIEVDATNAPGIYRVDWPDAAFATGVDKVILAVTATGVAPAYFFVSLADADGADVASILADTNELQADWTNGGRLDLILDATATQTTVMDANVVEVAGNSGGVAGFERAIRAITVGTVGAGSTTTSIVCSAVTPTAGAVNCWNGLIVKFDKDTTTAALRGMGTDITANTSGATPTLTVSTMAGTPVAGDTFSIE